MKINHQSLVGEIVADNYRYAQIFQSHNIDFCCNGNISIQDVCSIKNLDSDQLIEELNAISDMNQSSDQIDFKSFPLDLLVDYIVKTHHEYVKKQIPIINPLLEKIVKVHGNSHPELAEIQKLFNESADELLHHMKKEENILFPYIKKLMSENNSDTPPFGSIKNPIQMMMHEHDSEGERFRQISKLSQQYTIPENACNTYSTTYQLLNEFEKNLHMHIHIENNILFPKATSLEEKNLQ